MGVGRYLKEQKPSVQVVAVEPPSGELVQGLRNLDDGFVPPIFDPDDARPEVRSCGPASRSSGCAGCSTTARCSRASRRARRSRARRSWRRDGLGHDRHAAARRRVEVPLVGRVDRRPRRGRRARHADQLLVAVRDAPADCRRDRTRRRGAARVAASSPSRPRPCTASAPTRRRPTRSRRLYAVKGRPADHPVIVHLAAADQLDDWAADVSPDARRAGGGVLARSAHPRARRAPSGCPTRSPAGSTRWALRVPDQPVALGAAARVRRRGRGAVGQPVRAGEPDHRRRRARRPRRRRRHGPRRRPVPRRRRVDDRRLRRRRRHDPPARRSRARAGRGCARPRGADPGRRLGACAGHADVALRAARRVSRSSTRTTLANRARRELQRGARVGVLAPKLPARPRRRTRSSLGAPADPDEYARSLYRLLRAADDARPRRAARGRADPRLGVGSPTGCGDRLRRGRRRATMTSTARSACSTPGLGGLTVLRALIDLLPDERIVYFGDTGRFPYGPKPRDEVLKYALEITDVLLDTRGEGARGGVQQRGRRRARRARRAARHPGGRRDRARDCAPAMPSPAPGASG